MKFCSGGQGRSVRERKCGAVCNAGPTVRR